MTADLDGGAQPARSAEAADALRDRDRPPLEPGHPFPMLGWLRAPPRAKWQLRVPGLAVAALLIGATVALGTWGFRELPVRPPLTFWQSFYHAVRLYTLDLGPAGGGTNAPRPNSQMWAALVLAALLVARGLLALGRDHLRRASTRYLLRGHVIVCGGGVHGTELVNALSGGRRVDGGNDKSGAPSRPHHDVVLVDIDPAAPGMRAPPGRYEWRLVGDCVLEQTLITAGVAHAHWVVAMTGNDYVNSQIASTVQALAAEAKAKERVHVLVQLEDPSLTRFLEEDVELSRRKAGPSGASKLPVLSPFSANTIAAEALIDGVLRRDGSPLVEMHGSRAPNILFAGDHPLIDALLLAALRRWHEQLLRGLERGAIKTEPDTGERQPLHISVFGPDAIGRVERLQRRWRPEPQVVSIEATDAELLDEAAYAWLREEDRADHAFVVCMEELDGVNLTLGVSRALGDDVVMTRVTAQPGSVLDDHVQIHTELSSRLATTDVRPLAEMACDPGALRTLATSRRLEEALALQRPRDVAQQLSEDLFRRSDLEIHSDPSWRIPPCERELLEPLLSPVPLSALVRARLVVDLSLPDSLCSVATMVSAQEPTTLGFTAWCLYARLADIDAVRERLAEIESGRDEQEDIARTVLRLRAASFDQTADERQRPLRGATGPLAGARRVAILAGGAEGMSALTAGATEELLERALVGYDGVILSGGTSEGLPGVAGDVAGRLGIRIIGYVPRGRGDRTCYPDLRETPGGIVFSVREPLRMWNDILAAGIRLRDVRVLVFPGGAITRREILLARALGAAVASVDPLSEATEALEDTLPLGAAGVLELPPDPMSARAFLMPTRLERREERELLDVVARNNHSAYVRDHHGRKAPGDPALAPWDDIVFTLKRSSLAQVHDIPNKLALVGKQLDKHGQRLELDNDEVERLAEVEHGRWVVERLLAGWKAGPRDIARKTTPHLVAWADLDAATQEYDREAVRNIAPALEAAEWGVIAT